MIRSYLIVCELLFFYSNLLNAEVFQLMDVSDNHCLSVDGSNSEDSTNSVLSVSLAHCDSYQESQQWFFNYKDKAIKSSLNQDFCLTYRERKVFLSACRYGDLSQFWFFNQKNQLSHYAGQKTNKSYVDYLKPESEHTQLLLFHTASPEVENCFTSPFTGRYECIDFELMPAPDNSSKNYAEFSKQWPWLGERAKLTDKLVLIDSNKNYCLEIEPCSLDSVGQYDCFGGSTVKTAVCTNSATQRWVHDVRSKRIYNVLAGEHFCMTWQNEKLFLEHCHINNAGNQGWFFTSAKGRKYLWNGRLRWFSSEKETFNYQKALGEAIEIKFSPANKGSICGYDPINGQWLGSCKREG